MGRVTLDEAVSLCAEMWALGHPGSAEQYAKLAYARWHETQDPFLPGSGRYDWSDLGAVEREED